MTAPTIRVHNPSRDLTTIQSRIIIAQLRKALEGNK